MNIQLFTIRNLILINVFLGERTFSVYPSDEEKESSDLPFALGKRV